MEQSTAEFPVDVSDGSVVTLIKVFNLFESYDAYRKKGGLNAGDKMNFIVFRYAPCDRQLTRLNGHCDKGVFFPAKSSVATSYRTVWQIVTATRS